MNDQVLTTVTTPLGEVAVTARVCPACGADDGSPSRYSRPPWTIKACAPCGFVYVDPAPDTAALAETFAWERSTKVEEGRRAAAQPVTRGLSKATRFRLHLLPRYSAHALVHAHAEPGPVLDLGCGEGQALLALDPAYTPYGIEISAVLAATAQDTFRARGGDALHASAVDGLGAFPDGFFTAATLRAYLEHEREPKKLLKELKRVLKERGIAVVKVPNYGSLNRRVMGDEWCGFRLPEHLNYFTPGSLRRLAGDCGYECRFGFAGALPTSDNMWAVLRKA